MDALTTPSKRSFLRPTMATLQPFSLKARAQALPMPAEPPAQVRENGITLDQRQLMGAESPKHEEDAQGAMRACDQDSTPFQIRDDWYCAQHAGYCYRLIARCSSHASLFSRPSRHHHRNIEIVCICCRGNFSN